MTGAAADLRATASPHQPAAEVALALLTATTVIGFWRLFSTPGFLFPMLTIGAFAHLTGAVARRRGWGVPLTAIVTVPAAALLVVWMLFLRATVVGIPTADTATAIRQAGQTAWRAFNTVTTPTTPLPGFVLVSCAAVFFAVFLADWAAFRLWSAFEAVVPAITLFAFCSMIALQGVPNQQLVATALFLAALLAFLALHRLARLEASPGWLASPSPTHRPGSERVPGRLSSSLAGTSGLAVLIVGSLVLGAVVGPRLSGLSEDPVFELHPAGPGSRSTVTPLVNIRRQLVDQPNVEMFTVRASQPSYWRLASLPVFDGTTWTAPDERYEPVRGDLRVDEPPDTAYRPLEQRITVVGYQDLWLPAAFRPVKVGDSSLEMSHSTALDTLVTREDVVHRGQTYTVLSRLPEFRKELLRQARAADIPVEIRQNYTTLPDGFSDLARETAARVTTGARTLYDAAFALQSYFQTQFSYSNEFPEGASSVSAIDAFLNAKAGFCEQFAGTYAAMARSIGLPARVAVGFTPGVRDPVDANLFHVTGRQAHAWPEVYLGAYGWVPFEPTKNRGNPATESWTQLPPNQDETPPASVPPTSTPTSANVPPTSMAAPPGSLPPITVPPAVEEPPGSVAAPPVDSDAELPPPEGVWDWVQYQLRTFGPVIKVAAGILAGITVIALFVGLYLAVVVSLKNSRRAARRNRALDASQRVRVAWEECVEALGLLDLHQGHTETREEFARRVAPRLGAAGDLLSALAADVDEAAYAPDVIDEAREQRAEASAHAIIEEATGRVTALQQWLDRLDPRPLLDDGHREGQRTVSVRMSDGTAVRAG